MCGRYGSKYLLCLLLMFRGFTSTVNQLSGSVVDLLHNFDAIDPEVLNLFTFNNKSTYRTADIDEMDITDLDIGDILYCFASFSYSCFQKKIAVYLDSLNRVNKVNLFGGYASFVKVSQGVSLPITEQFLVSRHTVDSTSLGSLLTELFEEFVHSHILRITVPAVIGAKLGARSARVHCYDFTLDQAATLGASNNTAEGLHDTLKVPTCYRGIQNIMDLNSVALVKMVMLVQILMKIIVTKAIFGLVMGIVSMVLSKVAILPLLSSYANKNNIHSHSAVATTNALLRQGANPSISANPLMTDNYNFYYSAMPGGRVRLNTSSGGSIYDSEISSLGYISPTASPINNENTSSESKHSPYKPQNYNFKHIARKEKYRNLNRRRVAATPRKIAPASYPETATSERSIGENMVRPILTTVVTTMFNELEKNGMFEDNVQSIQCCQRSITSHSRKFINYNAP